MSQDSPAGPVHPKTVALDPAARTSKRMYDSFSASSAGLELGLSVIIGALFGRWLDGQIGTEPWMLIAFLILGFVAGMRGVLRAVKRLDRIDALERASGGAASADARETMRRLGG